jgi:DNA-binding NarL/FixJ family response regulator
MVDVTHIVVIDDHPIYRVGLVVALHESGEFDVVGQGETLHDAIALSQSKKPDVLILDINIPGNGLEALKHIAVRQPDIIIVMLTVSDRSDQVLAALDFGAKGYLQKGATSEDLLDCLRTVISGKRYIWPDLAAKVLQLKNGAAEPVSSADPARLRPTFTERELDVIRLLKAGKTNREIADQLTISEKTVKHHMSVIMQKLQVRNRVEATLAILKHYPQH